MLAGETPWGPRFGVRDPEKRLYSSPAGSGAELQFKLGDLEECFKLPSGVRGEALAASEFYAF